MHTIAVSVKQCPNEKILCLVKQKQFGHCFTSETKLKNGEKIAVGKPSMQTDPRFCVATMQICCKVIGITI